MSAQFAHLRGPQPAARSVGHSQPFSGKREPRVRAQKQGYRQEGTRIEQGFSLSGERQLLAFARALYRDPAVLVLDEATANVDSETEARLQGAVIELVGGRTSIVIAHRLSTIQHADRILVFHGGRIVEQGSHAELIARDGVYARLHRLQTEATSS